MRIQWWWAIKLWQCKWRCRILPHWSNLTFMASVYNIHPLTFKETTQCEFKRWLSFYNLEISLIQKEAHLAFHAVNVDPRGNLENLFNICGVFVHGCKTILCINCKTYTDLRAHCTMHILCLQAWSHWWLSSKVCCGCGSRKQLTHSLTHTAPHESFRNLKFSVKFQYSVIQSDYDDSTWDDWTLIGLEPRPLRGTLKIIIPCKARVIGENKESEMWIFIKVGLRWDMGWSQFMKV